MPSDDLHPRTDRNSGSQGSGPDPATEVGERIAGIPDRRLGEVLRASRRRSGVTVRDAALRTDLLQRWLVAVEDGEARAAPDVIADLLAHYGTDLDEVLPPRRPLLGLEGTVEGEEVLRRYLDALRRWRGDNRVGDRFRAADMEVLAAFLGVHREKVQRRLRRLAAEPGAEGSGWLRGLSRRRARRSDR